MDLRVEYVPIGSIRPYERNAKLHPQDQIEQIKESMLLMGDGDALKGFKDPIGVWHGEIVEGHGRYLAAKQLGMEKVPVIRLDDLTDEQRKAYTLIHNQLTMNSGFDLDVLNLELGDLREFDMSEFGFEFTDPEWQHQENQEAAQRRVESILGLQHAQYQGVGRYDIPQLDPVKKLPKIREWIGFNFVLSDKDPEGKAVHFFIDDYQFERIWREPDRYVEKLRQYVCVATPDFSPYSDMPLACQIFNHYRKHWVGRYLQERGLKVIPTIRASMDPRSFEWYLEGEPEGGIVMISSMWTSGEETKEVFRKEYMTMHETLRPKKVFLYGPPVDGLPGKIETIESFAVKRFKNS